MKYDLTLITPTGGRPEAFALCEQFVGRRQTDLKIQWIVINDFDDAPHFFATDIVRPEPRWKVGDKTLGRNIIAAMDRVQSDFILFIEDDDWYRADYFQHYYDMLQSHEIVGQGAAKYYNASSCQYMIHTNQNHASLCQTGIRTKVLSDNIGIFNAECPFYDLNLWKLPVSKLIEPVSTVCVGMKGIRGRAGLGMGHRSDLSSTKDHEYAKLRQWIGDDADLYKGFLGGTV